MKIKNEKIVSMVEKLLYIIAIDEQIMKYCTVPYKNRNERAKRVLADIRGELKQSLQADFKRFFGEIPSNASVEITKAYERETHDEVYERIKKALKPVFKR